MSTGGEMNPSGAAPSPAVRGEDPLLPRGSDALLRIKHLGLVPYEPTWVAMRLFTDSRGPETPDELWLVEHPPVYTQGQAGKPEHLLQATDIPVMNIDRGGQITYHGPGQAVVYVLVDLHRRGLRVRELVHLMEQALIDTLAEYHVLAVRKAGAPGVYVGEAKIAALGLRVRKGCSYHGLALNVDMDLTPFSAINPCGYPGLKTIQLTDLGIQETVAGAGEHLLAHLIRLLPPLRPAAPRES